ncbi:hypothetical protein GY45DRAFT_1396239 [Cubamyces sp. BRFM 1775]|nr:hypothetical protein GY45DRAFT_1396239 [Cubamyces sp. BRFM 1775]
MVLGQARGTHTPRLQLASHHGRAKAAEQAAQKGHRDAEKVQRAIHAAEGIKRLAELEDRQEAEELEEERELRHIPVMACTPSPNPTVRDQIPIPSTASKEHMDSPLVDYQSSSDLKSDDLQAALARIRSRPKSAKRQDSGSVNKRAPAQQQACSSKEPGNSQEVSDLDGESDVDVERSEAASVRVSYPAHLDEGATRSTRVHLNEGATRSTRTHLNEGVTQNTQAYLDDDTTRKRKRQEQRSPSPQGSVVPSARCLPYSLLNSPRAPAKKSKSSNSSAFRDDWRAPRQRPPGNERSTHASGSSTHSGGPRSGWRDALNIPTAQCHNEPLAAFSDRDVVMTHQYAITAAERPGQPKVIAELADMDLADSVNSPAKTPRQRRRSPNEMPEDQSRSATNLPDMIKSVFSAKIVPTVLDCVGSKRNPWDLQDEDRDDFLMMCQDVIDMVCDDGTAYRVTKQDTVYRLIQQKVYDWRTGMSNAAITAIGEELMRKFGTSPQPSVVRHWVDAAVADGGEAFWAKPHPDPQFAHSKLQSIYILKTFATHLTATRDSMYNYGYPAGALALATAAVQKAFPRFREGKYKAGAGFNKQAAEALTESWYDTAVHRFVAKPAKFRALIKMASCYMGVVKVRRVQSSTAQAPEAFDRSSPPVEQDAMVIIERFNLAHRGLRSIRVFLMEAVGIHTPSTKEQGVVLGKVCMPAREAGSVKEAIRIFAMVGAAHTPGEEDTAAEGCAGGTYGGCVGGMFAAEGYAVQEWAVTPSWRRYGGIDSARKASFMEKMKGEAKVLLGKIEGKHEKVEEGQRMKAGEAASGKA